MCLLADPGASTYIRTQSHLDTGSGGYFFFRLTVRKQVHGRHFRHRGKHPRRSFLGKTREVDFATLEKARWRRRSAARSARLSAAVLRSASNAGHAGRPPYKQEVVKRWTTAIGESDAFVFVTPEYNYGTSAVLKN